MVFSPGTNKKSIEIAKRLNFIKRVDIALDYAFLIQEKSIAGLNIFLVLLHEPKIAEAKHPHDHNDPATGKNNSNLRIK